MTLVLARFVRVWLFFGQRNIAFDFEVCLYTFFIKIIDSFFQVNKYYPNVYKPVAKEKIVYEPKSVIGLESLKRKGEK